MGKKYKRFPSRFFGLNKKQVDDYLESLEKIHKDGIAGVNRKLEEYARERERLNEQLNELLAEKDACLKSKEFMELALKRANDAKKMIMKKADEEALEILSEAKQNALAHDAKLVQIQEEIKNTRAYIDLIVQDVTKLLKKVSKEAQEAKEKQKIGNKANAFRVLPYASRLTETENNEKEIEKELDREEELEKKIQGLITADGTELKEFKLKKRMGPNARLFADSKVSFEDELVEEAPQEEKVEPEVEPISKSDFTEFWNDEVKHGRLLEKLSDQQPEKLQKSQPEIPGGSAGYSNNKSKGQSFWDEMFEEEIVIKTEKTPIVKQEISIPNKRQEFDKPVKSLRNEIDMKKLVEPEPLTQAPERTKSELSQEAGVKHEVHAAPKSKAISDEINQIRYKYVVGKVAGEDLLARDGTLIAAKNSVISGEVVDRAEAEGKLSELIVNMIIPGLD